MDTLYKKLLGLLIALVISTSVFAQEKVSKKISKTYTMTNAGQLQVENKYGHLNINGWDKDEISTEVIITVNHRKKENADELLQRIRPTFHKSDDLVSLGYEIAEKSDNWFTNFFEKANPFDYDRSTIQIDYIIYLPRKAALEITNTFGDIILEEWTGKLQVFVEHGDVWINEDLNNADITMRFGKLRAKNINYGSLHLRNGSVNMENATSLRINSSGTDIALNSVNSLELDSNKDDITIVETSTVYGTLKFSTIALNRLRKSVDMSMKVSDFSVTGTIEPSANIVLEQESSEINLNITDFPHRFDATVEQGLVRMPKTYKNISSTMLNKSKKLREINASYGKKSEGSISITGKKGIVMLKER